jgi:hypothetical protein
MKDTGRTRTSRRRHYSRTTGSEIREVILAIQELTLELAELRNADRAEPELEAKEQALERFRWRLASLARRFATEDRGAAA